MRAYYRFILKLAQLKLIELQTHEHFTPLKYIHREIYDKQAVFCGSVSISCIPLELHGDYLN